MTLTWLSLGLKLWQVLYDIALHPECQEILRQELAGVDRTDHKSWLSQVPKMDSFMKESQRLHAASLGKICRAISGEGAPFLTNFSPQSL